MSPLHYHAGQLAVQAEANSRDLADRMAQWVGPAGEFAERADMLVFAMPESDGHLRFAVISGPAPLATATGTSGIRIHAARPPHFSDGPVGGLAINLGEARRVRLNGTLRLDADGALLTVQEAFTLCRKYLAPSRGLGPGVYAGPASMEELTPNDPWIISVLEAAETTFLGSISPDGAPDVAHRGGPAGFLSFDPTTRMLAWPEYLGDGVFKSAGNVRATAELALLIPDLASGDAIVLRGRGRYTNERVLRQERRDPLVQHREAFPVQGRIACEVRDAWRLRGLMHPREQAQHLASINSRSSTHEQAPQ